MRFSVIVAADPANGIGKDGTIPWKKTDLAYFKEKTKNCNVIFGRKTWDSIGKSALSDRLSIVAAPPVLF